MKGCDTWKAHCGNTTSTTDNANHDHANHNHNHNHRRATSACESTPLLPLAASMRTHGAAQALGCAGDCDLPWQTLSDKCTECAAQCGDFAQMCCETAAVVDASLLAPVCGDDAESQQCACVEKAKNLHGHSGPAPESAAVRVAAVFTLALPLLLPSLL